MRDNLRWRITHQSRVSVDSSYLMICRNSQALWTTSLTGWKDRPALPSSEKSTSS